MPLETATYISQLVASNPVDTDNYSTTAQHLRLIKQALLNTLPAYSGPMGVPGWTIISAPGVVRGNVVMALPAGYDRYRLEWMDVGPTVAGSTPQQLAMQFGITDAGGTPVWTAGSADYQVNSRDVIASNPSGVTSIYANASMPLTGATTSTASDIGSHEFTLVRVCLGITSSSGQATAGGYDRYSATQGFSLTPTYTPPLLQATGNSGGRWRLLGANF